MSTVVAKLSPQDRSGSIPGRRWKAFAWPVALNGAATLHVIWFYLAYVRCYLDLPRYEAGTAPAPYQYRLLLMLPLRWAHTSAACTRVAVALSNLHAWFPHGVRPEALVEFPLDVLAVASAGLVTRRIYLAASPTGLLEPLVYPLTLLMVVATYALGTMYRLRFVYDLPSLGFFAAGMFLLYFRRPRWQFALLFLLATLNRETTLFLLAMFAIDCWKSDGPGPHRTGRGTLKADALFAGGLLVAWCAWHGWVVHRFAANGTESWDRSLLNLKLLLVPASWLQLSSCFAFCGPLLVLFRRRIHDPLLRAWLLIVPLWTLCMAHYGLLLENRIFGELIPLVACCIALGAEEVLLDRIHSTAKRPAFAGGSASL